VARGALRSATWTAGTAYDACHRFGYPKRSSIYLFGLDLAGIVGGSHYRAAVLTAEVPIHGLGCNAAGFASDRCTKFRMKRPFSSVPELEPAIFMR